MAEEVAEVTESLPKEIGLVGLDGPLEELDLTKMLAESFEPVEQEGSEETSPSGDAVEEAEPEWLQHRIDRFTRKLRLAEEERDELEKEVTQLRPQVDQVPAAVQQNGNPVAHIKSESELNKVADLAKRRLPCDLE